MHIRSLALQAGVDHRGKQDILDLKDPEILEKEREAYTNHVIFLVGMWVGPTFGAPPSSLHSSRRPTPENGEDHAHSHPPPPSPLLLPDEMERADCCEHTAQQNNAQVQTCPGRCYLSCGANCVAGTFFFVPVWCHHTPTSYTS